MSAMLKSVNENELICDEAFLFSLDSKLAVLEACIEGISAQWGCPIAERWLSSAGNVVETLGKELDSWLIEKERRTKGPVTERDVKDVILDGKD